MATMKMSNDRGSVTIEGTDDFVQEMVALAQPVTNKIMQDCINEMRAKGRTDEEIRREFLKELDDAAKKAGITL